MPEWIRSREVPVDWLIIHPLLGDCPGIAQPELLNRGGFYAAATDTLYMLHIDASRRSHESR